MITAAGTAAGVSDDHSLSVPWLTLRAMVASDSRLNGVRLGGDYGDYGD